MACKNNFEATFFGENEKSSKDKPFNAYKKIDDVEIKNKVISVFEYLCGLKNELSDDDKLYVCEYKKINELEEFIK